MSILRILYTGDRVEPSKRMRVWLGISEPFMVAGYCLTPIKRRDELKLHIRGKNPSRGKAGDRGILPLIPMAFGNDPYRVIPRAHRIDRAAGELLLIEIQYIGRGKPGWLRREDPHHEPERHLRPVSDA